MKVFVLFACLLLSILSITYTVSAQDRCVRWRENKPYRCKRLKTVEQCEDAGCNQCLNRKGKLKCYRGLACRRENYTAAEVDACRDNNTHVPGPNECLKRPGCSYCMDGSSGICRSDTPAVDSSEFDLMCHPFPDADITESECTAMDGCEYRGSQETDPRKKCVRDGCPSGTELRYSNDSCCNTIGSFSSHPRIVGGEAANQDQWPWLVAIHQVGSFGTYFCGGVLISSEHVLSAAHCNEPTGADFIVLLGSVVRDDLQQVPALEVLNHPDYIFQSNDIMLLRIVRVTITSSIAPIDLPMGEDPPVGMTCYVAGWGALEYQGSLQPIQMEVGVEIVSFDTCSNIYGGIDEGTTICAGDLVNGGRDSCQGDSGGPLMCQRCKNCDWYLAGIVSYGHGCALPGYPGVYTRVSGFSNWIKERGVHISGDMHNCDMYNI